MKKVEILKLKISKFKGIDELDFDFKGKNCLVKGANGVGKTTLFDAFCWCLWGKDSLGQSDFDIKPIVNGKPLSRAEHEVEVVLLNGDKTITLRRVYAEHWTKPRGQLEYEFKGHKTNYYINEEPVTATKYSNEVAGIVDEKIFQLLSNPLYFNTKLKWEQRREILLKMCGNIDIDTIIAGDESFSELKDIISNENDITRQKKIAQDRANKIKKEIESIPARINELNRMVSEAGDDSSYIKELKDITDEIYIYEQELIKVKEKYNPDAYLAEIKNRLRESQSKDNENFAVKEKEYQDKLLKQRQELQELQFSATHCQSMTKSLESELYFLEQQRTSLLTQYKELAAETFEEHDIKTICPTCGQSLPTEVIDQAKEKYEQQRKQFNLNKATNLDVVMSKGKEVKAEIEAKKEELKKYKDQAGNFATHLVVKQQFIDQMDKPEKVISEETKAIEQELEDAQKNYNEKCAGALQAEEEKLLNKLNELKDKKQTVERQLAAVEQNQKIKERIQELTEKSKELNTLHEEQRKIIYLAEKFMRRKINIVTSIISDKFKMANFVLFRENLTNDGVEECCETTLNDVPYKNINSAGRINVGMDIIETLIDFYQVSVPIFIDNAETVTELNRAGNKAQIIRLQVDKDSNKLNFIEE